MWGETREEVILLTWCAYHSVQAEMFLDFTFANEYIRRTYTGEHIFSQKPNSFVGP
jgi:hypothetical protein